MERDTGSDLKEYVYEHKERQWVYARSEEDAQQAMQNLGHDVDEWELIDVRKHD